MENIEFNQNGKRLTNDDETVKATLYMCIGSDECRRPCLASCIGCSSIPDVCIYARTDKFNWQNIGYIYLPSTMDKPCSNFQKLLDESE